MFEKYFAEFHVSEQELKEEIHSVLVSLNTLEPEQWPQESLECSDPNKPSQEILSSLLNSLPEQVIGQLNLSELELIEALRLIAIGLTRLLNQKHLDYFFIKQLYME